ncbi:MAG: hypothetical protein ACLS6W_00760 [Ruminococcus sp.]
MNPGDFVEFFTYFNSFSLGKWKKYTNVGDIYLHLRCKGHFKLQMFGHYREGRDIKKEMYEPVIYDLKELTDIEMMVPKDSKGQVIGFQIEVLPMTPEERKRRKLLRKRGKSTRFPLPVNAAAGNRYSEEKSRRSFPLQPQPLEEIILLGTLAFWNGNCSTVMNRQRIIFVCGLSTTAEH